jgi:ketosteroid isomerase-like protein
MYACLLIPGILAAISAPAGAQTAVRGDQTSARPLHDQLLKLDDGLPPYPAAAFKGVSAPASDAPDSSVAELREAVEAIARDAMSGNVEGLQSAHLASDDFTKFGPRSFERQDVESANESEAAFFTSVSDLTYEIRDLKIDVFGDIGVTTYYPHVAYSRNGERFEGTGRQTFVFLRTAEGWKLVHEHGTPRNPTW